VVVKAPSARLRSYIALSRTTKAKKKILRVFFEVLGEGYKEKNKSGGRDETRKNGGGVYQTLKDMAYWGGTQTHLWSLQKLRKGLNIKIGFSRGR